MQNTSTVKWCVVEMTTNYTVQKMKFFIKDSFGKSAASDLALFAEEILNGKLHFLYSDASLARFILDLQTRCPQDVYLSQLLDFRED